VATSTRPDARNKNRGASRSFGFAFPLIAGGIAVFGIGLGLRLPNRTSVVGWNIAWSGFDLALGCLIFATWLAARQKKWWAVATAGATTSLLAIDVWFSLTVFYSLKERPGIVIWAFVIQPIFAIALWTFVLRRVGPQHWGDPASSDLAGGDE
jgi:hypothetical protein